MQKKFLSAVQNQGGAVQANWMACHSVAAGYCLRHPDRCPRVIPDHRCCRRMLAQRHRNLNHQHSPHVLFVLILYIGFKPSVLKPRTELGHAHQGKHCSRLDVGPQESLRISQQDIHFGEDELYDHNKTSCFESDYSRGMPNRNVLSIYHIH